MVTAAPPEIRCYRCSGPVAGQCPQCRRPFCRDHGSRLCLDCRRAGGTVEIRLPLQGLPSSLLYRVALVGLVAAIIFIGVDSFLWLRSGGPPQPRPNQAARPADPRIPTPPATAAGATPAPNPVPTAAGERTHTVAEGETLSQIAAQYNVTVESIVSLNSLSDAALIRVDQVLRIPPR